MTKYQFVLAAKCDPHGDDELIVRPARRHNRTDPEQDH